MKIKDKKNLHIVNPEEDETGKIVSEVITELHEADDEIQEMRKQEKREKWERILKISAAVFGTILLLAVFYIFVICHTFSVARIVDSREEERYHNSSYEIFGKNIIKYSKDGVTLLEKNGKECWAHSYQMATPTVAMSEKSVVIADNGGNDMVVFQEKGVRGEIHTNLPIEKVAISEQGIVAAILKEEMNPRVVCYDAGGNLLAEHKAAVSVSGYPIEIAISDDGKMLLVTYMKVENGTVNTKVVYYDFSGKKQESDEYEVFSETYEDMVIPEAYFAGNETSILVSDSSLMVLHGRENPVMSENIQIDKKINSIFRYDKYIGMLLKNEGMEGYEIRLYTVYGKQVFSQNLEKEYSNIIMAGRQIFLYDNNQLCIYSLNGIKRFEGEIKDTISGIIPIPGINKYLVMNADGMYKIQFVK